MRPTSPALRVPRPAEHRRPRTALVVGAGMVGLATAWHLQEHGVDVTVVDRTGVAAGSSWGNAGWLTPGMAMPLADPSLWTYGPRALLDPAAPLHVPLRFDPRLWAFLARFMSHATQRRWDRAMAALTPIDRVALAAFDELAAGGSAGHPVAARTTPGPFTVAFEHEHESLPFLHELEHVDAAGQHVHVRRVEAGERAAQLTDRVSTVLALEGQRFVEPGPFVDALADSVRARGGRVVTGLDVVGVRRDGPAVRASARPPHAPGDLTDLRADAVVLATGAWLPALAAPLGVRTRVQAGRGYSFTVKTDEPVGTPIYLPARRVACTPYQGRFRIAGTMEFRGPDEPLQPRRIDAILASVRHLFRGVDLDDRHDEWVGSRPVTPDGLPLVGATRAPGVYVAGGHGMWGVVLGPATGRALAEQVVTGRVPDEIRPFDPLR
ncbi:FAD-dependent oxidoreductase [Cellulosimicrobium marinum]|uniref:FAD-dependent oxidoreductase n=1 Tax=Cellulosimicrobium marinum TaxID=1638992 RepID=UPI0027DEB7CE|nr:FAD-dependent oxidoreductase [Cellulosimicrobium marinum]MCB7135562.1 FAD-dependent oxidoreductase [Cellulosimicrobium marinum]